MTGEGRLSDREGRKKPKTEGAVIGAQLAQGEPGAEPFPYLLCVFLPAQTVSWGCNFVPHTAR